MTTHFSNIDGARKTMMLRMGFRWAMLGVLAFIAGCGTPQVKTGNGSAPQFPDPSHSTMPEGRFINVENLRKVGPGNTKRQLYTLLGAPVFDEGVFGVRKWNYIFNFRKADGSNDYFSCQYQVVFDDKGMARNFYWKPESCKSLIERPVVQAPVALPAQTIRLSSDALFVFDRADLTEAGRHRLDELLQLLRSASQVENIMVTGYTDRIGGDEYNLGLSQRRASTVAQYLVGKGVRDAAVQILGKGNADPIVQCNGRMAQAKLIACLAPNRRVELSGIARR